MTTYLLYGIFIIIAAIITKYSVPFMLSKANIPHSLVTVVNLALNVGTFLMTFLILYFLMQLQTPSQTIAEANITPDPTASSTPTETVAITNDLIDTPTSLPTRTPEPETTTPPTPTPAYLFQDTFDNDTNKWQLTTTDNAEQTIDNGKLILQLDPNPEAVAWTSVNDRFTDFEMEVDAGYRQGSDNHIYGLIVRKEDDDNFYQFALRQQTFNIWKYEAGEWQRIQNETPSEAINPPGQTNRLKLIAVDDQFQFFANDTLLADITDETFDAGGVGLLAAVFEAGEAAVEFDNLIINEADSDAFSDDTPEPTVQPGGGVYQLAFTKYESGSHNLYIANTNGGNQQLIFTRAAGPSFAPNKRRLFFYGEAGVNQQIRDGRVACEFGTISDGIVAVDLPSPLRDICEVQYDAWFCERKGVDLQAEPSDVCTANGISVYQNLDWKQGTARWASASPDNYAVAFDAKPGGERRIYFRSMLGANQSFHFELLGEQGAWSPNGQQMVYRSGRDNKTGLWISNRDDTGHTNITIGGTDSFPAWSPNGRTIAFSREVDGNWDIYTVNIDGSNLQRLTNAPGHDILPTYTPSGEIIFRSARTGSWGIWKMSGNGAGQRETIPNADVGPDWTFSRMDVK